MQGKKISDKMEHFFLDNTITCLFNKASICAFHSPNQVAVDDFLSLMVGVGGFKLVPLAATVYLLPELFGLGLDILRAHVSSVSLSVHARVLSVSLSVQVMSLVARVAGLVVVHLPSIDERCSLV